MKQSVRPRIWPAYFALIGSTIFGGAPLTAQVAPVPAHLGLTFAGLDWKLNGFGQLRYSAPGAHPVQFALGQYSLSVTRDGEQSPTFFLQAASTTVGGADVYVLESWAAHDLGGNVRAQAGRFLLPFSRQFLTSPSNLLFADISAADAAFNAPYAWGAMLTGSRSRVNWSAALTTSTTALDSLGQTAPKGRAGGVARLEINLLWAYGYTESDPSGAAASPQLSVGFACARDTAGFGSALQNRLPGDRSNTATVDAGFRFQRIGIQAALYGRQNHAPVTGSKSYGDWGGYVQGGWYVVRKRVEIAGRVASVDLGRLNHPDALGDIRERAIGANWYLREHYLKFQGDYTWSRVGSFNLPVLNGGQFRVQAQFAF